MESIVSSAQVAVAFGVAIALSVVLAAEMLLGRRLANMLTGSKTSAASATTATSRFIYVHSLPTDAPLKNTSVCLLLIDPQNDFCSPSGSLFVPGADQDCARLASAFEKLGMTKVSEVFVTLDTHQRYHIAHGLFWINAEGKHPQPFTQIHLADVKSGKWKPVRSEHRKWAEEYVGDLDRQGRFTLTIWPEHCLVGTEGHAVYPALQQVLGKWERKHNTSVNYVLKGNNAFTEHYSAIKAEVERSDDPKTGLNVELVSRLSKFDKIVVAGEAKSHCVNFTLRHLVENMPPNQRGKIWVCKDATSSVAGFEKEGEKFEDDMRKLGVRFVKSVEAFMY